MRISLTFATRRPPPIERKGQLTAFGRRDRPEVVEAIASGGRLRHDRGGRSVRRCAAVLKRDRAGFNAPVDERQLLTRRSRIARNGDGTQEAANIDVVDFGQDLRPAGEIDQ
jgi:hypothetical protein